MERIETRTQLVNFICKNVGQSAISRACHHAGDAVQVMGGFSRVPPSCRPGWIVTVTSVHGRQWLVAVTSDDHHHVFKAWITETIPWQFYIGERNREEYSIYDGDNPEAAYFAKEFLNERR